MRWTTWITVAVLFLAREASAQQAPATADPEVFYPPPRAHVFADLSFTRDANALICSEEAWFRDKLGARMGVDPFVPNPRGVYIGRVHVALSRVPGGFACHRRARRVP